MVRCSVGTGDSSLIHSVQTGCKAPTVHFPGREVDSYLHLLPMPLNGTIPFSLPKCLHGVDKDNAAFTTSWLTYRCVPPKLFCPSLKPFGVIENWFRFSAGAVASLHSSRTHRATYPVITKCSFLRIEAAVA